MLCIGEVHSSQEYYPTPVDMLKEGSLVLIKLKVMKHKFNSYKKGLR